MAQEAGRLRNIAAKLARLRGAGWERFADEHGVSSHRFLVRPPASESSLVAFEREHAIELVPEHRVFLAEVGDGGAGPAYGIQPLHEALRGPAPEPDAGQFLRAPFPHAFGASTAESEDGGDDPNLTWNTRGTMTVCETGCGGFVQLVVTGAARGRLLAFSIDGHVSRWLPDAGFLGWYEAWLDRFFDPRGMGPRLTLSDRELEEYEHRLRR